MKKISVIVIMLALLTFSSMLWSETVRGLGLHFGTLSANGFSYRQFNGTQGFQATLGAITLGSNDHNFYGEYYDNYGNTSASQIVLTEDGRRTNVNLGLNYLHALAENPTGRFYVFGGASYLHSRIRVFEQDYQLTAGDHYQIMSSHPERETTKNRGYYYLGAGLGFELSLGRGFKWAIEMPITLNEKGDIMMYIPQSGLYFYFD